MLKIKPLYFYIMIMASILGVILLLFVVKPNGASLPLNFMVFVNKNAFVSPGKYLKTTQENIEEGVELKSFLGLRDDLNIVPEVYDPVKDDIELYIYSDNLVYLLTKDYRKELIEGKLFPETRLKGLRDEPIMVYRGVEMSVEVKKNINSSGTPMYTEKEHQLYVQRDGNYSPHSMSFYGGKKTSNGSTVYIGDTSIKKLGYSIVSIYKDLYISILIAPANPNNIGTGVQMTEKEKEAIDIYINDALGMIDKLTSIL